MPSLFVLAEVMDKEPSILRNWLVLLGLGVLGLALSRFRWWAGLLALPLVVLYAGVLLTEQLDPYVGPAIRHEAGLTYPIQAGIAAVLAIGFTLVGAAGRRRRVA